MNPFTRETTFVVPDPMLGYIFIALRFLCLFSFYGGAVGVGYSIFSFESPLGDTLPVSPMIQCVLLLTGQFFFVYLLTTVMLTVSEVAGGRFPLETYRVYSAIEDARATIAFAPVLAILAVTTRMYALLITDKKGSPQVWLQEGMFMATWCLLMSALACLLTGFFTNLQTNKDCNTARKLSCRYIAFALAVFRHVLLLGVIVYGIGMVVVGLFIMTPETAGIHRVPVPSMSDVTLAMF